MSALKRSADENECATVLSVKMEDWQHARSVVGPSITRGVTVEIPKVSWEDIGGLSNLKVCNFTHSFQAKTYTKNILSMDRKSFNKLLSGLSNILVHFRGWEFHLYVEFFFMDLRVAQKPPLLKLLLMLPKLHFFI